MWKKNNFLIFCIILFTTISQAQEIRVALVLGGGGARALAHAGVIEVLTQNQIPIDLIVGTSGGALIGALYADQPNPMILKNIVTKIKLEDLVEISFIKKIASLFTLNGPVSEQAYSRFLNKHLKHLYFEQLSILLVAVTTDYKSGSPYALSSGPLIPAIIASSALPPFFSRISINGHELYDGGAMEPVPVHIAQQWNPKFIIAVNITQAKTLRMVTTVDNLNDEFNNQVFYQLAKMQANLADIVIDPDVKAYDAFDDQQNIKIYNAGKVAAEAKILEIKAKLGTLVF